MPRVRLKNAVPGLIRHLPHHKPWMVALSIIAIVVVVGTCGFGSYLLVRDDGTVVAVDPNAHPTIPKRDISNRTVDPTPLTAADVFPTVEIIADPSVPPYKRFGEPQVAADCRNGASGDLGKLLVTLGCNQVVRATFSSTDGQFLVTAGMFNMPDTEAATKAEAEIKNLSDQNKGRLSGYVPQQAVAATKMLGRSPTHVAWDAHEHFVLYTVICRVDGKDFEAEDPHTKIIVYDIVEKYLRDHVVVEWSIDKAALPTPTPSPSP